MSKPYTVKRSNKVRAYEPVLPLYNIPYLVYIGKTVKDAYEGMRIELGDKVTTDINPNVAAKAMTVVHEEIGTSYLILLGIDSAANILGTAMHEAIHLSWWMLHDVGVEIDVDNHEAQTYAAQRIFELLEESINEYKHKYKL